MQLKFNLKLILIGAIYMKKDKSIIQLDYWTSRSWAAFVFGCLLIMQTATITLHSLFSINTKNEQQILPLDFILLITIRISWFLISIVIMAGIRERLEYNDIPKPFEGMPIVLVTAGLMAIAFFGFSGLM